ncbi:AAA family ATPase [Actinomadura sp. 6N118]|uniref:AAA family ATPase n=1 Tax=Actinomadura sp. 6N118 TaxID=3375151 RepID=UPI0037B290EA
MTALDAARDLLCLALRHYLLWLRSRWAEGDDAPGAEINRLVAAVGPPPPADQAHCAAFGELLTSVMVEDEVLTALGLDPVERLTVAAVWWAETDPQFAVLLGCGHDDGTRRYASAALLRLVLRPFGLSAPPSWEPADPLVHRGLLEPVAGPEAVLRLTPTARRVLDSGLPASRHEDEAEPEQEHEGAGLVAALLAGGAVLLRGGPEAADLARAAVCRHGAAALDGTTVPAGELRLAARLGGLVPVVPAERLAELAWTPEDGPLVAYGDPAAPAYGVQVIDLPRPAPAERAAAWLRALARAGLHGPDAERCAARLGARLALGEADMRAALRQAERVVAAGGRELGPDDVWQAARRLPRHELRRVATLVVPAFTLDDLVLPADVRAQLEEIVAHVALQDLVLDEWGFRERLPRGQGVAVLLSGPPGTGKTMAADALAATLDQDLYRIDLSAVVSKYIGETEKNLALAFDEAERAAAVLFFDECDALFGRRTEQRDAHDRWANLEVNFLLQRVETFTGLVVLATNKRQALDEAFLRRLRFSIRFDLPGPALRERLWRRSFPAQTPLEELDVAALAGRELAGGSVQNAALAAAFLAAADGGRVRPHHLDHALRREYDKLGKVWTEDPA